MTVPVVEPLNPQAETAPIEPQEETEQPATEGGLPSEVLDIPAFQAVAAGKPPAVSTPLKGAENREELTLIADNKPALEEAGFGFYRSMDGSLGVMFNGLRIHPDDLVAADRAGKLTEIAPDFDIVNQSVSKAGIDHPALSRNRTEVPAGAPLPASAMSIPQAASGNFAPPVPASVTRRLTAQRVLNLQPGAPTSGPSPGAGRLMNAVLRPAV